MGACIPQVFAHVYIVLQVVFRAVRVQNVAGITDRAFADLARVDDGVHRDTHVFDPVE